MEELNSLAPTLPPLSPLSLLAEFGDPTLHEVYTSGPWAIWYHPDFFTLAEATQTADLLNTTRERAVLEYGMPDVVTLADRNYVNVYLHDPGGDDGLPDGWANGVGTNSFDDPYITFPLGAGVDVRNVAHEGFHIFQYTATSPGFGYEGDSQWYIETTAEWFSIEALPGAEDTYATAGAIAGQPHLALWHSFENARVTDPVHWMTETRQYGLHLFIEYLVQETPLTGADVTAGFFSGTTLSPQQVIADTIGRDVMADTFADMAGWLVASFSGGFDTPMPDWLMTQEQRDWALVERSILVQDDPIPGIEADIALTLDMTDGFAGQVSVPEALMTRAWSYNAIDIGAPEGALTVSVTAEMPSDFEMRLVQLGAGGWTIESLGQNGTQVITGATQAFLVVAAAPEIYGGFDDVTYALDIIASDVAPVGEGVIGTAGNDVLRGDAASNLIEGGEGYDLVQASGSYGSARVTGNGTQLSDAGGLDILSGIEAVEFDDGLFLMDVAGTDTGFLYRLYDAALDRAPDAAGFAFWSAAMAQGVSRSDAVEGFLQSTEFLSTTDALTDGQFLTLLYQQTLGRAPDSAGEVFWLDALGNGVGRAETFLGFSESAEHITATAEGLGGGVFLVGLNGADVLWG